MENKDIIIDQFKTMGEYIYDRVSSLPEINMETLDINKTVLFIIDMNNGFAKKGSLYSDRIEKLINPIEILVNDLKQKGAEIIAFTDYHTNESIELLSYPKHCIYSTDEWQLVDKLKSIEEIKVIKKNCTNGFLAKDFVIPENKDNFIIVGDCTDICIYQFAITIKNYFNENNIKKNIFVPLNLVDTFESEFHKGDFMNLVFLNSMIDNGIVVGNLKV
ncbi:isochorismatase family cysteine hydrolase [Clostridium fallax]|uniref:Nicotinamidase-related amidase n=1 Tax=Clostridium fallax TaxID=1533 RepID=A0A1M4Z1Q2_9CLOT|nr:isochorismatase family cysteine hydrolase [Clostridium fallax]SHF11920.1 Nicotinamidase-related amidase [Clostridium fallax]SQB22198.1 isochorismatase [Clostridium fallax]